MLLFYLVCWQLALTSFVPLFRFHGGEGCERVCYQTLETCIDLIRSLNATIPASDRLPRPGPQIFVTLMVDSRAGEPRDYLFSAAEWATMKSEGLVIHFP